MLKDQRGAVGIDTWFNVAIVMGLTIMFLVALSGMIAIFDARADAQQVANFIEQQYRDEGCISPETRAIIYNMITAMNRDPNDFRIDGEHSTPLGYMSSGILTMHVDVKIPIAPGLNLNRTFTIPIPVVSQYVPSPLLGGPTTCVSM